MFAAAHGRRALGFPPCSAPSWGVRGAVWRVLETVSDVPRTVSGLPGIASGVLGIVPGVRGAVSRGPGIVSGAPGTVSRVPGTIPRAPGIVSRTPLFMRGAPPIAENRPFLTFRAVFARNRARGSTSLPQHTLTSILARRGRGNRSPRRAEHASPLAGEGRVRGNHRGRGDADG